MKRRILYHQGMSLAQWWTVAATLLISIGAASPVFAEVLDQVYSPAVSLEAINSDLYRAQTFTVGITGQLTRVEALLDGTGSSVFQIWNTSAGAPVAVPGGTPLASGTVSFSGNGFFGVDITGANLFVNSGDVLALVQIGSSHTGGGTWDGNFTGGYTGGTAYTTLADNPTGPWNTQTWDLGFKTFVTVPEPSTLAISGIGLIGLAAYGWRRRKRTAA